MSDIETTGSVRSVRKDFSVYNNTLRSCYLCNEKYKDPKLLPCYHTFCSSCLATHKKESGKEYNFNCPLCEKLIHLPSNSVDNDLQSNEYVRGKRKKNNRNRAKKGRFVCTDHPGEENRIFCKDCNRFICVLCTISNHKIHDTRLIQHEAESVRDRLSKSMDYLNERDNIQKLEYLCQRKIQEDEKRADAYDNIVTRIREQKDRLIETVEKVAVEAETSVSTLFGEHQKKSDEDLRTYRRLLESFRSLMTIARTILEQDDDVDIIRNSDPLYKELEDLKEKSAPHEVQFHFSEASYTEGMINEHQIYNMIGIISDDLHSLQHPVFSSKLKHLPDLDLKFKSMFTSYTYIFGLAPIGENKSWVYSKTVGLFDQEGNELQTTDISNINSIAAGFNGDCFVSDGNSKSILRVTPQGAVETIFSYFKFYPKGLTFRTGEDGRYNLLVCKTEKFKIYESNKGFVDVLEYPNTGQNKSLYEGFSGPVRIATQPGSGLVAVSDYNTRRVTVHNAAGQVLSQYTGEGQEDCGFKPYGICFDNHGGILVCNIEGGNVLRISLAGELLQVLLERKSNVTSVAVDVDGKLWISYRVRNYGKVKVYYIK